VLLEPIADRCEARALLRRADDAGLTVLVAYDGALRRLVLADLLDAPPWRSAWPAVRALVAGKTVLVTGGGGSIGAGLARALLREGVARLVLLDQSEASLFAIGQEAPEARLVLGDVRDEAAVSRLFQTERPDLVFHAAALKQVPLVEAHPSQGVLTNVIGARNVADAARAWGADMVFVSTDKAANAVGVMGAAKRLAEMYCQGLDCAPASGPARRTLVVRLVNVLGSSGSVAPLFESQLAAARALTVTDPSMARHFITIAQAAEFLLLCAAHGLSAETPRGAVFVPEMGPPIPISEIAEDMIRLARVDAVVQTIGPRPGEKITEDLIGADETRHADLASGIQCVSSPVHGLGALNEQFERLALLARAGADEAVVQALCAAIAPFGCEREALVHGRTAESV